MRIKFSVMDAEIILFASASASASILSFSASALASSSLFSALEYPQQYRCYSNNDCYYPYNPGEPVRSVIHRAFTSFRGRPAWGGFYAPAQAAAVSTPLAPPAKIWYTEIRKEMLIIDRLPHIPLRSGICQSLLWDANRIRERYQPS